MQRRSQQKERVRREGTRLLRKFKFFVENLLPTLFLSPLKYLEKSPRLILCTAQGPGRPTLKKRLK